MLKLLHWEGWPKIVATLPALAAVAALVFTAESLKATRDQLALSQQGQMLAEQGQLTDRFSKAVEQLGSKEVPMQLGGIYAMERLAIDSPRDFSTIIEVLAAYVRQRSPLSICSTQTAIPVEVQSALTVIARRKDIDPNMDSIIDLHGTCLKGAVFVGTWSNADTRMPDSQVARSINIETPGQFELANFTDADLSYSDISNTDFTGANFSNTRLIGFKTSDHGALADTYNDKILVDASTRESHAYRMACTLTEEPAGLKEYAKVPSRSTC